MSTTHSFNSNQHSHRIVSWDHNAQVTVNDGDSFHLQDNNGNQNNDYVLNMRGESKATVSGLEEGDTVFITGESDDSFTVKKDDDANDGKITIVNDKTGAEITITGAEGQTDAELLEQISFSDADSVNYEDWSADPSNPVNSPEWDSMTLKGKILALLIFLIGKIEDNIDREAQALTEKGDNVQDTDMLEFDKQTQLRTTVFNLMRTIIDNLTATEASAVQSVGAR